MPAAAATVGYRIAERATGRGLATRAVRKLCDLAATSYGLTTLRATTTLDNAVSRAVPTRSGFTVVGESRLGGRPGLSYRRSLAEATARPGAPTAGEGVPRSVTVRWSEESGPPDDRRASAATGRRDGLSS
ncbi:GNAT family N-acetyltransferase [Streptomyces platensis]|uniref:GNAT family N-acetyltransferase n=1 Tax=Streptomyces platensis TaxID=58346 RepID=UPI0037965D3A